jgi:hypothetical protein
MTDYLKEFVDSREPLGNGEKKSDQFLSLTSPMRITLMGNSVVALKKGYTKHLMEVLNALVSDGASHQFRKYAIGGVPTLFGCYLSIRDDIAQNSDLILVDFCIVDRFCYDKYTSELTLIKAIEGLIRHIKSCNYECNIVFINQSSVHQYYVEKIAKGECEVTTIYNLICDYYELPIINVSETIIINRGQNYFKKLYHKNDPFHVSEPLGARIVANLICRKLTNLKKTNRLKNLPEALYPDNYSSLKIFQIDQLEYRTQGKYKKGRLENRLVCEDYTTIKHGSSIKFRLDGKLIALYIITTWTSGYLTIKVGDRKVTISCYSNIYKKNSDWKDTPLCWFTNLADLQLSSNNFVDVEMYVIKDASEVENYIELHSYTKPESEPDNWELNLINICYQGQIE